MGAGQSSSGGGGGDARDASPGNGVKTSYYDLLGLQRQATDEEIKKAYRRKALELHPDRNYGDEQAATKTFAEVQAAYEVLSDPQERAWYDSHESAILRGDDVGGEEDEHSYQNVRLTTADDLARIVRKFNGSVEFSDAPSGFFGFLREHFDHLAKEEEAATAWETVDAPEYPGFGHAADTHDDVVKRFYAAWANFSTVKNFAWKDRYRLSEAPDRRIRRLMEKENGIVRREAAREFNEAVRSFVLFVRKRDPRYKPSTQSEAERQQTLRDAAAAQAARARAANLANMSGDIPEWTRTREPEELTESSEGEVEEEVIECVACNKVFKSDKQFEAHERSKKHQKAIQSLRKKMEKDSRHLDLDNETSSGVATPTLDEGDHEMDEDLAVDQEVLVGTPHQEIPENADGSPGDDHASEDDPVESAENVKSADVDEDSTQHDQTVSGTEDSIRHDEAKAGSDEESDGASLDTISARLQESSLGASADDEVDNAQTRPTERKMGKAAQKRAKKAASAEVTESTQNDHKCSTCNAAFPSRRRLFQHIEDYQHAALKPAVGGSAKGKKGKGKR